MARLLHIYPKAQLIGSEWTFITKVYEAATGITNKFFHTVPAGVTATTNLLELKLAFDLTVDNTDTDQDVDDALFVDDIKPGPTTETVWDNWQQRAEAIIAGLTDPYTLDDYHAEWSQQDTAKTRSDARRALITQRGWSVTWLHQHEGDGTTTEEGA